MTRRYQDAGGIEAASTPQRVNRRCSGTPNVIAGTDLRSRHVTYYQTLEGVRGRSVSVPVENSVGISRSCDRQNFKDVVRVAEQSVCPLDKALRLGLLDRAALTIPARAGRGYPAISSCGDYQTWSQTATLHVGEGGSHDPFGQTDRAPISLWREVDG